MEKDIIIHKIELKKLISEGYDYASYRKLIDDLWVQGMTTGHVQDPNHIEYTKVNIQRMKRLDHTIQLRPVLTGLLQPLKANYFWIVITEGWCGDSAQNLPWINKMQEISNGAIKVRFFLRDKNIHLIDTFLTNGARAIPKLICFDMGNEKVLGTWGPRPNEIQKWYLDFKNKHPEIEKRDRDLLLHQLYSKNKGEYLQDDFEKCLNIWK